MALSVADGVLLDEAADSYVSLATADLYHEALGRADWALVDDDKKEVLLRRASSMIAARYTWNDVALALTTVPSVLYMATSELAYSWISSGPVVDAAIKAVSVGAINVQFATQAESAVLGVPPGIWGLVDMLLNGLGSSTVVSGTGSWRNVEVARA